MVIGRLELRIRFVFQVVWLLCFREQRLRFAVARLLTVMPLSLLRVILVRRRRSRRRRGGAGHGCTGTGAAAPADAALAKEQVGEVELGVLATELEGLAVVRHGGVLGGVEGAEPQARAVAREADLRHPLPPVALPHAAVELGRAQQLLVQRRRHGPGPGPGAEPPGAQVQRLAPVAQQQHLLLHLRRRHELRREQRSRGRPELLLSASERNHLLVLQRLLRRQRLLEHAAVLQQRQEPWRRSRGRRCRRSRIVRERKYVSRRRRRHGVGNGGRVRGRGSRRRERGQGAVEAPVGAADLLQGPEQCGRRRVF
uniref:Uncharacterized protein n=1 Tax=Zea mays TaxID=4577 RepID=A0A804PKS2_MAIZE